MNVSVKIKKIFSLEFDEKEAEDIVAGQYEGLKRKASGGHHYLVREGVRVEFPRFTVLPIGVYPDENKICLSSQALKNALNKGETVLSYDSWEVRIKIIED